MPASRFAPTVSTLCIIRYCSCGRSCNSREQDAIAQHIGNFVPVAGGMQTLQREVVGIIGTFGAVAGPLDESGVQAVAHFLLLHVQLLLRHFLPSEAKISGHGDETKTDAAAGRQNDCPR